MPTYLYLLRLRDRRLPEQMTPTQERVMEAHFGRLQRGVQESTVLLAGPCTDGAFGIVVYKAASPETAQAYADADPAVSAGLMSVEVHPFRVSLMRGQAEPPPDRDVGA
jgi:uncharacterized protein YciI